jgi:hypothetical protein
MHPAELLEDERRDFYRRAQNRRKARETRIRQLGYEDYTAFLRSPDWEETRRRYWRDPDTPKACGLCGTEEPPLQLHHRTYERVGAEHLSDLVPTCLRCHQLLHALDKRGDIDGLDADLTQLTDAVRAARYRERRRRSEDEQTSENLRNQKILRNRLDDAKRQLKREKSKSPLAIHACERRIRRIENQLRWLDQHPALVIDPLSVDHKMRYSKRRPPPTAAKRLGN